jgi:hypothetical protein
MEEHEEIWLVQLQNGAVRAMSLDELDAAFQDGSIDEDTFVRREGASKWIRLREELGAQEPVQPPPPQQQRVQVYEPLQSIRPVVSELDADEVDFAPKKSRGKVIAIGSIVAVAACALAVFGATKIGASAQSTSVGAAVVNAAPPPPVVVAQPEVPQAPVLSVDQKKALADKDTQLTQKLDQKKQARQKYVPPVRGKTSPPPFHKGGNEHDPLNAKL